MNLAGPRIDLRPDHWVVVREILKRHVPDRDVLAFGSRATWTAKHHSDLDLAVLGDEPLSLDVMSMLAEAFGESNLPFKVDVVDWALTDDAFRSIVRRDGVAVQNHKGRMRSSDGADTERISPDKKQQVVHSSMQTHVDRVPLHDLVQLTLSSVDKKRKQNEHDVLLCNYMDVYSNPFIHSGIDFLAATATEREIDRCGLRIGDVIITKDSEAYDDIGVPALVREDIPSLVCGYHLAILRPSQRVLDSTYLYYVLQIPEVQHQFHAFANGVTRFGLRKDDIHRIEIPVHALQEQRAIAEILGILDDKIELNRRMNETLQAIARGLFKSWFVDFEPVRAKTEHRPTCLPQPISDLFADKLDEKGNPAGWELRSIHEFAEVRYGAAFASKKFRSDGVGVPLIRIRDLATHAPGVSTEQIHQKGHLITPGDIVVGMDGEFRLHIWKGPGAWLNQRVCHFEPKHGVPRAFVAEALREPLGFFERANVGTTVVHLGKSDIDTIEALHPGTRLLRVFADVAEPLLDQTVANALQSRTLAQTRDLLLPRLISGEIRVQQAEKGLTQVL